MNSDKKIFEKIYEKRAVWTQSTPPKELVDLIENGEIKPCKALDIGCGEGLYSIYLASKGFNVTGIDISQNAVKSAKKHAKEKGLKIRFIAMDIKDLSELEEKFDFVFEWALMHHIMPPQRQKYVEDLSKILKKGGKYLSFSFNEKSPHFNQPGKKYRITPPGQRTPPGVKHYFSSMDELKNLFKPYFKIIEAKVIHKTIVKPHISNFLFMERL